ncbi:recombinase family protein [Citrobacter freundii]|uniref:recombinase family protein n=1 Tax=Enterobacteriaceae TaxID=543 RepID=UPI0010E253B6|nr:MULTISPECIES: recombinase family protein [Enterobacteriaceae]MDT7322712.1 recombinase family protein [Citrobacter freundii]VGC08221.1 putative alcohol dehydrogenase class III [Klebsiella pneumoniae]
MGHRAAIYCRVSTADQSCERQEFDLRAFAGRAGYDVVGIFKETGSGTKLDRAERKKVLALAQSRQIDAILVTELSRWGRSTLDLLNTLRELENWKVSVIAMNGMAFDLSSPGTVAKLAMRQPFVLFKGLTFQKLCLPGAFRPGDHHNKMLRPGLCVVHASPQYL